MHNIEAKITGDKLVITIDVSKKMVDEAPSSASGKTFLVATTAGAMALEAKHCKALNLAINLMAKR
jgi:hypothetical protein